MKKLFLMSLVSLMPLSSAFAAEADLVLPGAKWVAKFNKYVCAAFQDGVARPEGLDTLNVQFETMLSDSTLDNGLLTATFEENGKVCRYSALVFADNAASTVRLVESKAYAPAGDSDCLHGKAVLDRNLESNNYLYYGHPHNLAIMMPVAGVQAVCGAEAQVIGVNFVVAGRIQQ